VAASRQREFGHAVVEVEPGSDLLGVVNGGAGRRAAGVDESWRQGHRRAAGFRVVARTPSAPIAAMEDPSRRWYGVQFHPEVTHTRQGDDILRRFARDHLRLRRAVDSRPTSSTTPIAAVREQVGDERVVLGLSGGVDSSVVAALLSRAIGDQLTCVFVDNGLLRKNERAEVRHAFAPSNALDLNLVVVDAEAEFLMHLAGHDDPEDKRKIIGNTFIDVFDREAASHQRRALAGAGHHLSRRHRVRRQQVRQGSRDQVAPQRRRAARAHAPEAGRAAAGAVQGRGAPHRLHLGLPRELVYRHPFPGPGLGVRVLGEVTKERADVLREADASSSRNCAGPTTTTGSARLLRSICR
jgi:GMP synthase (glutamine-hydrolysing)